MEGEGYGGEKGKGREAGKNAYDGAKRKAGVSQPGGKPRAFTIISSSKLFSLDKGLILIHHDHDFDRIAAVSKLRVYYP